jgi:ATP-dependent DNA helicase RecQ
MSPLSILRQYWGYEAFRPLQEEIIDSVLGGKDTLALLPTGGGKSICFQVPALAREGMAVVISPLIALMKDQVENLLQRGIPAAYVNSSMEKQEVDRVLQAAMDGAYRLLYVAPERIHSEMFRLRYPQMPVHLLVVDEAHCISQWGYDFRPSYMDIPLLRADRPEVPLIALTASATPKVQEDILDKLSMQGPQVFRKSFRRPNLRYFVLEEENVTQRLLRICQRTQGTGIIYVRTRKRSEGLAQWLQQHQIAAAAYHGGLPTSERDRIQQEWIEGKARVMVATNAFGMGIDKPDVRFVLHLNLPFDLESYYQEAGRGGRDGETALAIAFDNPADIAEAQRWVDQKYPTWEEVKRHYDFLTQHFNLPNRGKVYQREAFDIRALAQKLGEGARSLYNSIRLLDREGLLKLQEEVEDYGLLRIKAHPRELHTYKSRYPLEGEVLDYALRSLGGEVFRHDLRFLPGHWCQQMMISLEELRKRLARLVQHEMIFFQQPMGTPMITFFEARRRLSPADLDWSKYEFLRKQSAWRFQEMLKYLHTQEMCRSLMIQQYFGEQSHEPCGRCDVCIGRRKTQVSDQDFRDLKSSIMAFVAAGGKSYREVVLEGPGGTPAQREKVLRYLLDKELLTSDAFGKLKSGASS